MPIPKNQRTAELEAAKQRARRVAEVRDAAAKIEAKKAPVEVGKPEIICVIHRHRFNFRDREFYA